MRVVQAADQERHGRLEMGEKQLGPRGPSEPPRMTRTAFRSLLQLLGRLAILPVTKECGDADLANGFGLLGGRAGGLPAGRRQERNTV